MKVSSGHPMFPDKNTDCKKLRQGQLLMQRYQMVFNKGNGTKYQVQADEGKRKSVLLAAKMVAHANQCPTCRQEQALTDPTFYGVFK